MDVQEAVFISPLPGGAWDNRKVGSVWEEPPAGGLPRTTPNLNILMARVSAMTLPGGKFTAVICHRNIGVEWFPWVFLYKAFCSFNLGLFFIWLFWVFGF